MKKLLATFSYLDNFYELYVDTNGNTSVILFGRNKHKIDNEMICKKVIDKINELRNEYSHSINFKGEKIDVFNDRIVDLYYFKKDGIRIKEDNKKYFELYKMHNYLPDYYGYNDYNGYNNSQYDPYNTGLDNQYYMNDYNYKQSLKKKKKRLKIIIGSITLSVTLLVGSFIAIPKIINTKNDAPVESESTIENTTNESEDTIGDIEDTPVIVYEDDLNLTIEEQIIKSIISNCGEQPQWVYDQVIEDYNLSKANEEKYDRLWTAIENGASQEEIDKIEAEINSTVNNEVENNNVDINLANQRTSKMINAINSNKNISEEDKQIIINGLFNTMQIDSKYYTEDNFERILELLSLFTIDKKYLENNAPHTMPDGLSAAGECSFSGLVITIYSDRTYESTLCHEVEHCLGKILDTTYSYNKINEGITEVYCGFNTTYNKERSFYIMLEQIYGEDFFKSAYYNKESLYSIFQERFGDEKYKDHYDLCIQINGFLIDHQLENDMTNLYEDNKYQDEINNLINSLMIKYKEVTGLDWNSNIVLLACQSFLTGVNKTLPDNLKISGIKRDLDGKCYLQIGGNVEYTYEVVDGPFVESAHVIDAIQHDELIR